MPRERLRRRRAPKAFDKRRAAILLATERSKFLWSN
jgi:hypothetical protein